MLQLTTNWRKFSALKEIEEAKKKRKYGTERSLKLGKGGSGSGVWAVVYKFKASILGFSYTSSSPG